VRFKPGLNAADDKVEKLFSGARSWSFEEASAEASAVALGLETAFIVTKPFWR
jgi:hypothetical protein